LPSLIINDTVLDGKYEDITQKYGCHYQDMSDFYNRTIFCFAGYYQGQALGLTFNCLQTFNETLRAPLCKEALDYDEEVSRNNFLNP